MGTDNGGDTWQGVSAETITVAVPWYETGADAVEHLEAFFNSRFEFYGRRLDLVPLPGAYRNDSTTMTAEKLSAEAERVDDELKAFASTSYIEVQSSTYYDALASRQVLSVNWNVAAGGSGQLDAKDPYQWAVQPPLDVVSTTLGGWICRQLKAGDGRADHAGPELQNSARKFGYLFHTYIDGDRPSTAIIDRALEGCGAKQPGVPLPEAERQYKEAFGAPTPTSILGGQVAMKKLMDEGVTSVICICHAIPLRKNEMPAASSIAFFPEWLTTSFALGGWDHYLGSGPQEQMRGAFGLNFHNKAVPTVDLPVTWAIKEVDPAFDWQLSDLGRTAGGDWAAHFFATSIYPDLLLLASGIQMAGPNLTPRTFADGLHGTTFPNTGNDNFAARVGFGGGRHYMVDDAVVVWWGVARQSTWGSTQGSGAWCFANGGARQQIGETWPAQEPLVFTGSCY